MCNHEILNLIELRKVLTEERLMILAIYNEKAEQLKYFPAAGGINIAVASSGSSALPVTLAVGTSILTAFFI